MTLITVFLSLITTRSSDDYLYGSFVNNGIGAFVDHMKWHYANYNGRTVIHIIDSVILHFGNICFALVCLACQILLIFGILKLFEKNAGISSVVFCAGFILIPTAVMVEGYYWISAFCNYLLPVVWIVWEIVILKNNIDAKDRVALRTLGMAAFCFLCGASHDQTGIVSCGVCAVFAVVYFIKKSKMAFPSVICLLSSICGFLTIVLSPATQSRIGTTMDGSHIQRIVAGLKDQTTLIKDDRYYSFLILICFVLIAFLPFRSGKAKLAARANMFLIPVLTAGMYLTGEKISYLFYFLILIDMFAAGCLLVLTERYGFALLPASVISNAVMTLTGFSANRTLLPSIVYLIVLIAGLAGELKIESKKAVAVTLTSVLTLCALVYILPKIGGYYSNSLIYKENVASAEKAKETKEMRLCIDYDHTYTHHGKFYEDGFFYSALMDMIGQEENGYKVYLYGKNCIPFYIDGELMEVPALKDESGTLYLPLCEVLEAHGMQVYYDSELKRVVIDTGKVKYNCDRVEMTVTIYPSDGDVSQSYTAYAYPSFYTNEYAAGFFEDFWGMTVEIGPDKDNNDAVFMNTKDLNVAEES